MAITVHPLICAALLCLSAPAQAAVLSFDLSGLDDSFQIVAPVSGGFAFDTDLMVFDQIAFRTDLDDYTGAVARLVDGTGFGLPAAVFAFETAMTTFFFGIDGFDPANAGLAVGQGQTFGSVFGFESDSVTPDFQIGLNGRFAVYFGDVTVMRAADPVAPIPLPASLPLLVAGLGLLALSRPTVRSTTLAGGMRQRP